LGKRRVTYKLMPETIERVKRCAEAAAISQSEYVEAAVRENSKPMEFLNDERRQSSRERRRAATREYRRILQEARDSHEQKERGTGVQSVPWFAPFHEEAEAEFQRLKELREFQRPARGGPRVCVEWAGLPGL
jgi:hypothetical protein